jgi:hypothetical protein
LSEVKKLDIATLYKVIDELEETIKATVPYQEDQLSMANEAIRKMKYGISRVLTRLKEYE